ncbi:hypothetical protein ABEO87_15720 [Geobacillus stearothermophilus]|uniref:hypothetical protein n=1 Tax=Geobacillus stearothermophilus TaxID=1422 RepID=UPI003D19FCFD
MPAADQLTLNDEEAVNDAKAAFDALTDAQKALVPQDVKNKLDAAVAQIAKLKQGAEQQVKFVDLPENAREFSDDSQLFNVYTVGIYVDQLPENLKGASEYYLVIDKDADNDGQKDEIKLSPNPFNQNLYSAQVDATKYTQDDVNNALVKAVK